MGAAPGEPGAEPAEKPTHLVRISRPFYLGTYEVTQAEYRQVVGSNPSQFQEKLRPVELVSWQDAVAFCQQLSESSEEQRAGRKYRLPTEAEWEYACRTGTTGRFHLGDQLNGREANCDGSVPYGQTS